MIRKMFKRVSFAALAAVLAVAITGCSSTTTDTSPAPASTSRDWSAPAGAATTTSSGSSATSSSASASKVSATSGATLTKNVPASVIVNEDYTIELVVRAANDLESVTVVDEVPAGSKLVGTEPKATLTGNRLNWDLGSMSKGDSRTMTVRLTPLKEGEIASCATVTAVNRVCAGTVAGRPQISIEKSGPEYALIGSTIPYTIVVKNTGTALARDVVVVDTVPAGLSHESGNTTLSYPLGDMPAGTSKTLTVNLKADQRGRFCNVAKVSTGNAGEAQDDACTTVQRQGIEIVKTGTKEQFVHKQADYQITVTNTGDTKLTNVVVRDVLPSDVKVLSTDGGTLTGNVISWTTPELAAGATKSYKVTLVSTMGGERCNHADVTSNEGQSAKADACTFWKGMPALLLEVVDTVDPLLPEEGTEYIVRITNQGTADDKNVKFTAKFPAEISPVSGTGSSAVTVNGKTVTVAAIAVLAPKQVVEWKITAKAVQTGDARLNVGMTSDLLKTPVNEEESTHVY